MEMNIEEQENALFERWAKKRPDLVRDGVVNEQVYFASAPRTMFVLKEANHDPKSGTWNDLRPFLREGACSTTWDNVVRWTCAAREPRHDFRWQEVAPVSKDDRIAVLSTICAVNLKKTPGRGSAVWEDVVRIAHEDATLLLEQITLYDPQLVICCGTGELFAGVLGLDTEWSRTKRDVWYRQLPSGAMCIGHHHPAARTWQKSLFYELADALNELAPHVPGVGAGAS